ncbi:MAG: FimV family protein [Gammaproteobacteria bacterium]|nr:FimV family protein [Gammaproteobacteria bacterium]
MLRKLPLAIAIALAVAPFHSQALGLGKIKTRSVLNQPFDAEIQLLSVPPGELDGVRVNLATPEAFDRAGVDRPYLLSKLRFKTLRKANGDAAIEVFSRNSIQEPYLNFLVEVNWPRGRMVREFTVLLDPPLTTGRRAAAVTTPTSVTMPASAVSTRTVQPESMARVASDGEYGPVQRNETLWTIANGTRPAGASTNQMMLAILKANPQAFAADNINTLKAGSILRIPSAEDVKALSAAEATQIANQQYADWKQGAVKTVAAPKTPDTPATTPIQQPATTSSVDEEARLKLSGSDVAGQSGAGEDAEAIKQELLAAQEKVITAESESDEIRGQMEEMQAELLDLKRLLELKDRQLSQLQAANDESMATAEETVEMVEETVEETIEESAEDTAEETVEMVEETVEMVEEAAEATVAEDPTPAAPASAPEEPPVEKAAPPKEQTLLEMITGSAAMMGIAVAVLVVLLALIWAAFSRRNKAGKPIPPPQKAATADDVEPDTVRIDEEIQPAEDTDEDNSFLSEFTPADLDELDNQETGEVDPISEADVYIAYGRFDQAEELVQTALEQEPGKVAYQHKLLEIYYANKDAEKFTVLAQSMADAGAEAADPDAWNRTKLMGADIDPENALFADAMDAPSQDITEDLDMALSELESQLTEDVDAAVADLNAPSEDLEDLDLGDIVGKPSESDVPVMETPTEALAEETPEEVIPETVTEEDAAIEELAAELEAFDIETTTGSDEGAGEIPSTGDSFGSDEDLLLDDDLGGVDEIDDVSTKIDLARAYVEMGDKEGAKGILEEVLEEGSEAQKQEAQTLIAEIS